MSQSAASFFNNSQQIFNQSPEKPRGLFLVWKQYQRRAEALTPLLNCHLEFMPHLFSAKYFRPLDYFVKFLSSIAHAKKYKPQFIVAQCPPIFSAIPARILQLPYVIDAHNPLVQVKMWRYIPFTQSLVKHSMALIVHNHEIARLARTIYPHSKLFTIPDFIKPIHANANTIRQEKKILVICSFDFWDEPISVLIESMTQLKNHIFFITAETTNLPNKYKRFLQRLSNVRLTGFLPTRDYHALLCSSSAALVLTTREATQPSGACEALASDTPLIVSKTSLTRELFGEWAILVDNTKESIVEAVTSLSKKTLDLSAYRNKWNASVKQNVYSLRWHILECVLKDGTSKEIT